MARLAEEGYMGRDSITDPSFHFFAGPASCDTARQIWGIRPPGITLVFYDNRVPGHCGPLR